MASKPEPIAIPLELPTWGTYDHHDPGVITLTLAVRCSRCYGTRMITNPVWDEWDKRNPPPIRDDPEAREPYPDEDEEIDCPDCEGRGLVMTGAGEAIVRLIREFPLPDWLAMSRRGWRPS